MSTYTQTYKAVCSDCSIEFKIFAENNKSKPIYCQECYWKRRKLGELQSALNAEFNKPQFLVITYTLLLDSQRYII